MINSDNSIHNFVEIVDKEIKIFKFENFQRKNNGIRYLGNDEKYLKFIVDTNHLATDDNGMAELSAPVFINGEIENLSILKIWVFGEKTKKIQIGHRIVYDFHMSYVEDNGYVWMDFML